MITSKSRTSISVLSIVAPLVFAGTVAYAGHEPPGVAPEFGADPSVHSEIAAYVEPVREARALQFAHRQVRPAEIRELALKWVGGARRGELSELRLCDARWQNPGATLNQIGRSRDWIARELRKLSEAELRRGNLIDAAFDEALATGLPRVDLRGEDVASVASRSQ